MNVEILRGWILAPVREPVMRRGNHPGGGCSTYAAEYGGYALWPERTLGQPVTGIHKVVGSYQANVRRNKPWSPTRISNGTEA